MSREAFTSTTASPIEAHTIVEPKPSSPLSNLASIPTTQEARELEVAIQAVTSSDRVKRFRSTLRGIDQPGSSRANRLAAARIAHEHVIRVFDPRFQDHDRVWSERQGRWLGRGEVIELVDAELLEALGEVCGWAGEGDEFARESSQLRGLMKLVWSRLARELPDEVGAKDLGPESAAGRHFWGQMQGVMLSAAFMVRPGMNVAPEQVSAAMLIRRDRDQRSQGEWKAVGEGIPVWTRWRVVDGARRFEVSTKYHMVQGAVRGKSVESATCSTVLTKLARRYGVADPEVGAVTRAADRPTRLLVLSQDFMEDLLANLEAGGVAQNEDESRNNAA